MDGAVPSLRPAATDPMVPRTFHIIRRIREVDGCFTLHLRAEDGRPFSYKPGQFNMLYVFGVGEVAISISGDCRDLNMLVHTVREVGTVTRAMARLKPGDVIGVRGPFGNPWPIEEAYGNDILFVTGTIGLAPLRPLIYEVLNRRDHFGKVVLCYGSRGMNDILYEKLLHQWRGRFDMQVHVTVHTAPAGYRGRVGSVAPLVKIARFDPESTIAYVCRSETMTRPAIQALYDRGVTADRIYVTLERNMKCGVGFCGHCQMGGSFMCKDGPVYRYDTVEPIFSVREL
jgi:NAD(P)H-flavin reductase